MAQNASAAQTDQMRIRYGFWLSAIGLGIVGAVFIVAVMRWPAAADVSAVVGSVTGVVGTIVGAFFGVQVGSAGKEQAEAARKGAEERALRLAAAMPPDAAARVLGVETQT
jgi:hypothetical protein